jgi:uncharacterized protein
MHLRSIFINNVGRLRSGWRLLLYGAAVNAVFLVIGVAMWAVYGLLVYVVPASRYGEFLQNLIFRFTILGCALLAGYLCAKFLEGLPWRSLGLTFHAQWFRDLLIGSVIGILSLAVGAGVAYAGGGLRFGLNSTNLLFGVSRSLLSSGFLFIFAALAEEALARGYPLQTLTRAHLTWLGVLLTSIFFATLHLANPNLIPIALLNTALAGVWLAAAYLRTRSLWFPLGVHWAWNWALGSLFGLPVSGLHLVSNPLLIATDTGPNWLTGGSYGLEGGIAGTVGIVVSTLFIWRTKLVSANPELLKLTSEENPAVAPYVLSVRPTE